MHTSNSRSATKPTLKNGRHRLPVQDLEKLLGQAQKTSEHAAVEVSRIQALLDTQKHNHRMDLGGVAILRRLVFLNDKAWGGLSGRLENTLPEEPDHEALMYWLNHRPRPEADSPHTAEKATGSNRQDAKSNSAEDTAQEPSQATPSSDAEATKNPVANDSHSPNQSAGETGDKPIANAENR